MSTEFLDSKLSLRYCLISVILKQIPFQNVMPDPSRFCGPYEPIEANSIENYVHKNEFNSKNHDTIGMVAIDAAGNLAAGTSTNGARHKIPG